MDVWELVSGASWGFGPLQGRIPEYGAVARPEDVESHTVYTVSDLLSLEEAP